MESLLEENTSIATRGKWPNDIPIGSFEWRITTENGLCQLPEKSTKWLTFSQCFPGKFTCNSGHCIPLSDRCNIELDCADESDEKDCDYLSLGPNYGSELIPRDNTGAACLVYINATILAFPEIDTVNLKFTADFYLHLRWYDFRIDYKDLNNLTTLNSLSESDRDSIWSPTLAFVNALGPYTTVLDDKSSGILVREGAPLQEDITLPTEVMLFSGNNF